MAVPPHAALIYVLLGICFLQPTTVSAMERIQLNDKDMPSWRSGRRQKTIRFGNPGQNRRMMKALASQGQDRRLHRRRSQRGNIFANSSARRNGKGRGRSGRNYNTVSNYYWSRSSKSRSSQGDRVGRMYYLVTRPVYKGTGIGRFPPGWRPNMIRPPAPRPTGLPTRPPHPNTFAPAETPEPLVTHPPVITPGPTLVATPAATSPNSSPVPTSPGTPTATTTLPATTTNPSNTTITPATAPTTPPTTDFSFRTNMGLTYFSDQPEDVDRDLTAAEFAELQILIGEFYTDLFQADPVFATNFRSYTPITTSKTYTAGAVFPPGEPPSIALLFDSNFVFAPGTAITDVQVLQKMLDADYEGFITNYLRRASGATNQLDLVQQVSFNGVTGATV
ncbi:expressed unknown protein [Seminavis robusta]|uniref:Uncharacterized protein n=1 Tax=Seminavis robusta TaxID=568900 RepID=A0A9N8DH09_9STRA|nr:expressed unknown protein [Seminavis robusta]|eukprot:Sro86_g045840.1 n/a (392) ;mRNA; r:99231-100406